MKQSIFKCQLQPVSEAIAKGLYGTFIVDPKDGWPAADHEFVMVMNGIDVDFDDENDLYAVNTVPFHYQKHPIPIAVGAKVRVLMGIAQR